MSSQLRCVRPIVHVPLSIQIDSQEQYLFGVLQQRHCVSYRAGGLAAAIPGGDDALADVAKRARVGDHENGTCGAEYHLRRQQKG
jgi:hypothetical protein